MALSATKPEQNVTGACRSCGETLQQTFVNLGMSPLANSYLTAAEIKQKIFNPKSSMAEGFEKEWEKGKMPDKFKDVMEDSDAMALATWLSTFKNTSVNTPRPIKKQ